MYAFRHRRRLASPTVPGSRGAFTLVELVVVIVILAILASLTLSGLNGARQRAKIDKTRSTIRKLHEIVMPIYEGYVEKRYSPPAASVVGKRKAMDNSVGSSVAGLQVEARRIQMAKDFPDVWDDAWTPSSNPTWRGSLNPRYAARGDFLTTAAGNTPEKLLAYESAECLQMIVVLGGFAADAAEQFRADEIGDVDGDGAPEFLDGWGRPISFIRWPAGLGSVLQTGAADQPDPVDPFGVTKQIDGVTDRALIPLIYSGGPNNSLDVDSSVTAGSYGLVTTRQALGGGWQSSGWLNPSSTGKPSGENMFATTRRPDGNPMMRAGYPVDSRTARDNITNHDLVTK